MNFNTNDELEVISKSQVRYTGTLTQINNKEKTFTLEKVRVHGTEQRKALIRVEESELIYEYIVFKSENIESVKRIGEASTVKTNTYKFNDKYKKNKNFVNRYSYKKKVVIPDSDFDFSACKTVGKKEGDKRVFYDGKESFYDNL